MGLFSADRIYIEIIVKLGFPCVAYPGLGQASFVSAFKASITLAIFVHFKTTFLINATQWAATFCVLYRFP